MNNQGPLIEGHIGPPNYADKTLLTISLMKAKYMKQSRLFSSMPSILIWQDTVVGGKEWGKYI